MKLKVKKLNFETGNVKVVVLNSKDAEKLGQRAGERVLVRSSDPKRNKFGELIAILNSSDLLEIAVNMGRASEYIGMEPNEIIGTVVRVIKKEV